MAKNKSRPIHDALRESLDAIEIAFKPTLPSFKRDRFKTANSKEYSVDSFLEAYFPSNWSVKKGPIYDNHGNISDEVDCALCIPDHPPCETPKRDLILAEGVHAAVEVKPDINSFSEKGEFVRALKQSFSVKQLKRTLTLINRKIRDSWPDTAHRIPYIIFAKEMQDLEKTAHFMTEQKLKNNWSPWDLPDIVLGYQTGLIYHAPEASICSITPFFERSGFVSGEGYLLFPTRKETLILFLTLLHTFVTPQPQASGLILRDYLFPMNIPPGMKLIKVDE